MPGVGAPKQGSLIVLLGSAMVTSTLLQGSLGVMSSSIIHEFRISRSVFGLAFAVYSIVGGLSAYHLGAFADRNSRQVMRLLFAVAAVGTIGAAVAPTYGYLLMAMVVGGLALGAGNPVTNRIVAEQIPLSHRGPVIGFKQAGPPLGILIAGLALPTLAVAHGWRAALAIVALLPVSGFIATRAVVFTERLTSSPFVKMSELSDNAWFVVRFLTLIGFGVAMASAALIAFLPLFGQEELDMSPSLAGATASAMGLAAVIGRIVWGLLGGRFRNPMKPLLIIAVVACLSTFSIAISDRMGVAWLWVGAFGCGMSVLAWHALAWMVLVDRVGVVAIGRASGIMHAGGTTGFALGAPLAGLTLDLSNSYETVWILTTALLVLVVAGTFWFRATVLSTNP